MLQIVRKLKMLKRDLKELNNQVFRNIVSEAKEDREALQQVQVLLQGNPSCKVLQQIERDLYLKFRKSSFLAEVFM